MDGDENGGGAGCLPFRVDSPERRRQCTATPQLPPGLRGSAMDRSRDTAPTTEPGCGRTSCVSDRPTDRCFAPPLQLRVGLSLPFGRSGGRTRVGRLLHVRSSHRVADGPGTKPFLFVPTVPRVVAFLTGGIILLPDERLFPWCVPGPSFCQEHSTGAVATGFRFIVMI